MQPSDTAARNEHNAEPGALEVRSFACSAMQLGLLLFVINALALEESLGLIALTPILFFGFCLHAWLPGSLKLPAFLALSITGFFVVLGTQNALLVVAISLGLVGICHLPLRLPWRSLLLVLAGVVLGLLLVGRIETSWSKAVVPVVAAMFMFRSVVYLYDLRTEEEPTSIWMRLSYFFLLPNVCFLLFPVVDYRTFKRTYYGTEPGRLHQRGIHWMLRGILHLLCYRAVYAYLTPTVAEIQDLASVVRFIVSSFLLYLRISGHFHLIVGMLHLFGFYLPETNHHYLYASNFADCWRRINTYWMDFMKKIVYFPVFARLRHRGTLFGMVTATALTFVATWLLHSYQWFWLHGAFPLATDGLFWGAAGALAVGNMLWEARSGEGGRLTKSAPSWGRALRRSLQAFGIFCMICTVWSLWCSASLEQWLELLSQARHAPRSQVLWLLGGSLAIIAAGTMAQRIALSSFGKTGASLWGRTGVTATSALALALFAHAPARAALGPTVASVMEPLTMERLNDRDRERLIAGYYDRLIDREVFGGRVAETTRLDPDDPEVFRESGMSAETEGPLQWELPASTEETFQEVLVTTNRWGMRDKEYTLEKPEGTFRIAILGACYEMGTGVSNEAVWEARAEETLNRELGPATGRNYEVLNFSVAGYDLLQMVTVARDKVPPFRPDLVVVSNHVRSSVDFVLKRAKDESVWPHGLKEMVEVTREETGVDWEARLESWAFEQIAAECKAIDAVPIILNVPPLEALKGLLTPRIQARIDEQLERARAHGYSLLDLRDAFEGSSYEAVAIPHLQRSPSAEGHRLLSEEFCEALLAQADGLGVR